MQRQTQIPLGDDKQAEQEQGPMRGSLRYVRKERGLRSR
jgi:hypothetical protein